MTNINIFPTKNCRDRHCTTCIPMALRVKQICSNDEAIKNVPINSESI